MSYIYKIVVNSVNYKYLCEDSNVLELKVYNRDFKIGDTLELCEINSSNMITGYFVWCEIINICDASDYLHDLILLSVKKVDFTKLT